MHDVFLALRQGLEAAAQDHFDGVIAWVSAFSADCTDFLRGAYAGNTTDLHKAIAIGLSKTLAERSDFERAMDVVEQLFLVAEKNKIATVREAVISAPRHYRNLLTTVDFNSDATIFQQMEGRIVDFLSSEQHSPKATLGCALVLLMTRCAVITRPSLRVAIRTLEAPVLAVNNWWYMELYHQSKQGKPYELRRVFLDVVTASFLIRRRGKIVRAIADNPLSDDQKVRTAFKAFLAATGAPSQDFTLLEALSSCRAYWLLQLPGFLYGFACREVESHSIPASEWLRMHGVKMTFDEIPAGMSIELQDLLSNTPEQVFDFSPVQKLLEGGGDSSGLKSVLQSDASPVVQRVFAKWLLTFQAMALRPQLLRAVYPLVGELIAAHSDWPAAPAHATEWMDMTSAVAAQESGPQLALITVFWSWFFRSEWCGGIASDSQEGVNPNMLAPHELARIKGIIRTGQSGVLSDALRTAVRLQLAVGSAIGSRRAEAFFLRKQDAHISNGGSGRQRDGVILIRKYALRRLKSAASQRSIRLTSIDQELLDELQSEIADLAPDDLIIPEISALGVDSAENVYAQTNRFLQQQFGPLIHYHHLRHTRASWACLQLSVHNLSIHDHRGRCSILSDVLHEAPAVMSLLGPTDITRRAVWAVSALLGHVDPRVTLRSYVHTLDWLVFFSAQHWKAQGYDNLVALASGIPVDTVVKHRRSCAPDGYDLLHRLEKEFPDGVKRFIPAGMPETYPTAAITLQDLWDVEQMLKTSVATDTQPVPTLHGPLAIAEAEELCRRFGLAIQKDTDKTISVLQHMNEGLHSTEYFIYLARPQQRQEFRAVMTLAGFVAADFEIRRKLSNRLTAFEEISSWASVTRFSGDLWIRFRAVKGERRSGKALQWVTFMMLAYFEM